MVEGEELEVGKETTPLIVKKVLPASKSIERQAPTPSKCVPFLSFPQRLKKLEKKESTYETLEFLKQVKVNIPLFDMTKEVPGISKFLKDLCT